jgi:hypothetical protein
VNAARGGKAVATALLLMMFAAGCEAGITLNAVRSKGSPGALNTKGPLRVIAPTCIKALTPASRWRSLRRLRIWKRGRSPTRKGSVAPSASRSGTADDTLHRGSQESL